jgi:hypothetical protein
VGIVVACVLQACGRNAAPDATLSLYREGCWGTCPVYTLAVTSHGAVSFDGKQFTAVKGHAEWQVSVDTAEALIKEFERLRAGFLASHPAAPSACAGYATAENRAYVMLRDGAGTDSLHRYVECRVYGSSNFEPFAARIFGALRAQRYVGGARPAG